LARYKAIYSDNCVNSGEALAARWVILSEASKEERATTIPQGSTLKRVEAHSIPLG